jgi:hypothetical protein
VDGIEAQFRGDSDLGRQIGLSRATSDLRWMVPNVLGLLVEYFTRAVVRRRRTGVAKLSYGIQSTSLFLGYHLKFTICQ